MPVQFSIDDLRTPEGLERVLRQFEIAIPKQITVPAFPSASDLAAKILPTLREQLQAPGSTPLNLTALLPSSGGTAVDIEDVHANRLMAPYTPASVLGATFFETDRTVTYVTILSGGTLVWRYKSGQFVSAFASRPADLGTNDSGFLFYATDQDTIYIWTGAAYDTISRRILLGGFYAIFTHANAADRTYTLPNATGNIPYTTSAALAANILLIGSSGTLPKLDTLGTAGSETTVLHGSTGAATPPTWSAVDLAADVTGVLPAANGGSAVSYNRIVSTVALTNQAATVGPTTVASAGSQFIWSYTLLDTTADLAAGSVQMTVNYTDDAGATSQASVSLALTALGRTSGVLSIQRASGNITYTVTLTGLIGSAKYAFYAVLQRLS